ncbi:MAG: wax ester/triacylglycerol synthase family O-acyltransferase [Halieaceae bacterium]|jgi:diacylglycerol O-acyltransferase|nr:wax ester/triacylglycerol synthase family O-acyltransferase [Halieaceae bacterium]
MTPEKLSFQDAAFLRLESEQHPIHVAGLMILKQPDPLPRGFYRRLARHCGRLNELWPLFNKKLANPDSLRSPAWVPADDYDPAYHVSHYALPAPGRMDELLALVARVHERLLDRHRPLWEVHLIEGLSGNRFALYCKVHHALVDGVGALRMVDTLFSTSPDEIIDFRRARPKALAHQRRLGLAQQLGAVTDELKRHYAAIPEMSSLLAGMGMDKLMGKRDKPPLPFTAPRTLFNTDVDKRRAIVTADLSLATMRRIADSQGATINDVLLAVCGGALRKYLKGVSALPADSLEAGVPVSIKASSEEEGNRVGFIIAQLFTDEPRPLTRLKRIVRVTRQAKADLRHLSKTAAQDYANLLMMPTLILTLTHRASQIPPPINVIVSNVPGSRQRLYLEGARLEALYPLSVVTDGMGINITVVSYLKRLCVAITSCPTEQPGIETLGRLMKQELDTLAAAV